MKKLLVFIAVGTAMLVPAMPAAHASCIHVNFNPFEIVVHPDECFTSPSSHQG